MSRKRVHDIGKVDLSQQILGGTQTFTVERVLSMGKVLEWINLDPRGHATSSKAAKSLRAIFVISVSESQMEAATRW